MANKKKLIYLSIIVLLSSILTSYIYRNISITNDSKFAEDIPSIYTGIAKDEEGKLFFQEGGIKYYMTSSNAEFVFDDFDEIESGCQEGIILNFKKNFSGKVLFGLYPNEPMKFPKAVFFNKIVKIENGKALLKISKLRGSYDIADWEKNGFGRLQYRVLTDDNRVIVNKNINFSGSGPFAIAPTIITGPIISQLTDKSIVISYDLNTELKSYIEANGKKYTDEKISKHHEIRLNDLQANKEYSYKILLDEFTDEHTFTTAPEAGSSKNFSFAFASDSRGGLNVGETNTYGTNAYVMSKLTAFLTTRNIAFFQFTGDLISGYTDNKDEQKLEYTNWYRTVSSYIGSIPLYVGMGNHEALLNVFDKENYIAVDKFPFGKNSSEAVFSEISSNPNNGPESEDGSLYDLDKTKTDFPSYSENVYSYTYGNAAMIVLNSDYLYTPAEAYIPKIGGNPHGYIMDNQLLWLENEIAKFEKDKNISHVFVTIHTPAFPNGGNSDNDMWYSGNNDIRPYINGKAVKKGIIERRDEFLNILVNKSTKFRALLSGDEHNYSRLTISSSTDIYPENYKGKKLILNRPFVQIVDGSAGAPYYGKEKMPWTNGLNKFSSQYAVVFFNISGEKVDIEVVNPESFEIIDKVNLH